MEMYLVVRTCITTSDGLTLLVLCKEDTHTEYHWRVWRQVQEGYYTLTMFTWEDAQNEVRRHGGDSLVAAVPVDPEYLDRRVGAVLEDVVPEKAAPLKVYLLSQTVRTGANTYDSCVVIASTEDAARTVHPTGESPWPEDGFGTRCWVPSDSIHLVKVEEVGVHNGAKVAGTVLCRSFNYN